MSKNIFLFLVSFLSVCQLSAQNADSIYVDQSEIKDIVSILASDSLKGRGNHTIELAKAADYIAKKFTAFGLQTFPGWSTFQRPFYMFATNAARDILRWNGKKLDTHDFTYLTTEIIPTSKTLTDFKIIEIENNLPDSFFYYNSYETDVLIWIKKKLSKEEELLSNNAVFRTDLFKHNVLIVANENRPENLLLRLNNNYYENILLNIVGVLPGKSKPGEVIIFSAHYDHIGTEIKGINDGIYNGANDNASGVAALLMLAQYYTIQDNNERTLVFCAFSGEELGLLGSKVFVNYINPKIVKAVINMDMIGIPQKGKNHVVITGPYNSRLSKIFRKNLSTFKSNMIVDPDNSKDLFERSDNYPFALKGVAAQTILSCDDFDDCYHQPCDEVKRLDIEHIRTVIKAIIQGCSTIVSGESTP